MSLALKRLRHEAGLTLEELAQATGLTRSYVSKVERGLSAPSVGVAIKLARALEVPVDRLFGAEAAAEAVSITRRAEAVPGGGPRIVAGHAGHHRMTAFVLTPFVLTPPVLKPGESRSQPRSRRPRMSDHEGEEILYVLKGAVHLHLAGRAERLEAGDCAQFDASIPHRVEAAEAGEAEILLVIARSLVKANGG